MLTAQQAGSQAEPEASNKDLQRQWLYDKAYNLTMIPDSLRGTMVNSVTANDQISHATWTGSGNVPMSEERFTYDKNLNISRRQTWVNGVLESETNQCQEHGRVVSREYRMWRHTTQRINPKTVMPEEGKFVRVLSQDNTIWKYDVNGRLVEKLVDKGGYRPLQWRYRWDARSQLTGLETPEGERWEYRYDPFGRRISKRCINRDKSGMDFHWNGDQLTEEIPVNADGTPDQENAIRWIYEPGSFTPLARYENGKLHYTVTDTVGRVQELLTEDGTIVWRGKQQLWGREEAANDNGLSCRLRFPGQYEDAESGLYYNRFRYYDCDTGQYLCTDPIGLRGGLNLYSYVPNPLTYIDPLGLCKLRGSNGRFRSAQNIQEEIGGLPNFSGKTPGQIRQTLRNRGYSSVQAHSGGEVWTKGLPDGNTVAVRLDPAMQRTRPRGFADEVPHAHIESLPTSGVVNGNYGGRNNPVVPVVKYDVSGNIAVTPQDSHISMRPGRGPYR